MNSVWKYLVVSVLIAAPLMLMLRRPLPAAESRQKPETVMMYCAAGMKNPVAAIARQYEAECGIRIELQYGGSGTLLSNLKIARQGDLYLAADSSYTQLAEDAGLVQETRPVAYLRPVIAVPRGNPKGLAGEADLLRADIQLALANPDAASIGKQTRIFFQKRGIWDSVEAAVMARGVFKPTVNDVANDVKLGTVDAAVVWDATVNQYPELEAIPLAGAEDFVKTITIGVLSASKHPSQARKFAQYLTAPDKGLPIFRRMGFPPVEAEVSP